MATRKEIEVVWEGAATIRGRNPDAWRRDAAGNVIRRGSFGTHGTYGWHVDHNNPKANRDSGSQRNQRALQWEENLEKSDET